jgi:Domain of unknown function (DUF4290)
MVPVDMITHGMEYNTEKIGLIFPEYGRNIQAMILLAKEEKDMTKRQLMVEAIVQLMYQMNPQSKNVDDYKEKLWKHVFHIADYNLGGVLPPNSIHPTLEDNVKKPEPLKYPPSGARFRHYGNNVHLLISKAQNMEDGEVKEGLVGTIGAYMKLAYRTWNKEHYVSDEIIKNDLETLSNGTLELDEDQRIDRLATANKRRRSDEKNTSNRSGSNNNGGDRRNNNNNNGGDRRNNNNNGGDRRNNNNVGGGDRRNNNSNSNNNNNNRGGRR